MKKYQKPQIDTMVIQSVEKISSLGEWLESGTGSEYKDAGITTYIIES